MKKNDEKRKKNEKKLDSHEKILDDFHDFVSECVSFSMNINNPFWEVIVFPKKSDNFHWT